MKNHLKQYIGWYFLVSGIILCLVDEAFTGGIIILATLLKAPPFDWVGKAIDWAQDLGWRLGLKLKEWKDKQVVWIRVIVTIICIILFFYLWWLMPECEIC
jgi:hypothetical protein